MDRENYIIHVMNSGFDRAAASFSQLVRRKVQIVNAHSVLIGNLDKVSYVTEQKGQLAILTTHVIGDIAGKSYLIFNQDEADEIFRVLQTSVVSNDLKDAFLKEIDNIISASVISELANALDIEIYGDVPHLTKVSAAELEEFMRQELNPHETESMIFCNTSFQFENHEKVNPHFIWKLNSRIFDLIPIQKITA